MNRIAILLPLLSAGCPGPNPPPDGSIPDLSVVEGGHLDAMADAPVSLDGGCLSYTPPTMLFEDICPDHQAACYIDHAPMDGY